MNECQECGADFEPYFGSRPRWHSVCDECYGAHVEDSEDEFDEDEEAWD